MNDTPTSMSPALHTALRCLFVMCLQRGVALQPEHFAGVREDDPLGSVLRVVRASGLRGKVLKRKRWKEVLTLSHAYPMMALMHDGCWRIIFKANPATEGKEPSLDILDPIVEGEGIQPCPRDKFMAEWSGILVACKKPSFTLVPNKGEFGFRWFIPEMLPYKRYFRDVAIATLLSAFIAFATPLMFQIMIDKVITHHSYQTLYALLIIFIVLTLFDSVFQYVRQYLMNYLVGKIDTRLAARTFQHLLSLPLFFFERTTAGVLTRHMQQTETIRNFLTGRLFLTFLDMLTLPLMLIMLFVYSVKLTMIVLVFSGAMAAVIGFLLPTFRKQLEQLYQAEGAKQGHLVETIHGIRTVKSLTLEASRAETWNQRTINSVKRRVAVGRISAIAGVLTKGLEKLMQVSLLCFGAFEVFNGNLSIGSLVAFNMISGRVSGPLVQMVGLINEYQETSLAIKMLGHVMGHPPERDPAQAGMVTRISGAMDFDEITFRYNPDAAPALEKVSFSVQEGQVIAIVGRSGSGKTTITRLIQGIQMAQQGTIRLDGTDIRHIDLQHLRRSIGVVLQENFLFRGTVRENIAAAVPGATLADVVEAARMAGADEFIDRLPHSYETFIEENGANFSGGQRQRIAIARALLTKPKLLIFDEATSALDPESEVIVQENLNAIAKGRTLIIVSHRLTSIAGSDAILVLDRGRVIDFAPHTVLLDRCDIYRHLWQQQTKHFA